MAHRIKARIVGDEAELGPFSTLTVHGCELSSEFSQHEVEDEALAKLKGNRFVEVLVRREADTEAETPAAKAPRGKKAEAETPAAEDPA